MSRVVVEGVPHHITQRGNNRQDVFLLTEDRRFYLNTLDEKCRDHGVSLLGYCLMTNHVHLVAIPRRPEALSLALGETHGRYSRWFNKRYRRSGHLWQNRFYSSPLGGSRLWAALAYVDLNAVRAGLARGAGDYPWSSAREHLAGFTADTIVDVREWTRLGLGEDWRATLAVFDDAGLANELRRATYAGQPFGEEAFVTDIERRLARPLRPRRPGPKTQAAAAGLG